MSFNIDRIIGQAFSHLGQKMSDYSYMHDDIKADIDGIRSALPALSDEEEAEMYRKHLDAYTMVVAGGGEVSDAAKDAIDEAHVEMHRVWEIDECGHPLHFDETQPEEVGQYL